MGIWTDIAQWVGPPPHASNPIVDHLYVVEHIADGSYLGTIAWQKNPTSNVSSHFIVAKDGRIAQMVDTSRQAWTQIRGNPYSISIENEGFTGSQLTPQQVAASALLLERAHREHRIPLQVTGKVGVPGLGHHSMGYESGVNWGHQFCPGKPIIDQKPTIVQLALRIAGGDVAFLDDPNELQMASRIDAIVNMRPIVVAPPGYTLPVPNEENKLATVLNALMAKAGLTEEELQAISDAAREGAESGAGVTHEELVSAAEEGANLAEDS